jgi:hypothetical protein
MNKTVQLCQICGQPLKFRDWSKRYPKKCRDAEALAECPSGCGKFQVRYFDGVPTSEPYQVRTKAIKTKSVSARIEQSRYDEIIARYGSFQKFVDSADL